MSRENRWLVVLGATLCAIMGLVAVWFILGLREPAVTADKRVLDLVQSRLGLLKPEIDTIRFPEATKSEPSDVSGCSVDSGEVFQPRLTRFWHVAKPNAAVAARHVADALQALGWKVSPPLDTSVPGAYALTIEKADWFAKAAVIPTFDEDQVFVEITVQGLSPCRLA